MTVDRRKSVLLMWRHPPYGRSAARDTLDIALAFGAFEQDISLLFLGDGVFSLLAGHETGQIAVKSLSRMMSALEMYGVERRYVSESALRERGINSDELALSAALLDNAAISDLISQKDLVISL